MSDSDPFRAAAAHRRQWVRIVSGSGNVLFVTIIPMSPMSAGCHAVMVVPSPGNAVTPARAPAESRLVSSRETAANWETREHCAPSQDNELRHFEKILTEKQ